LTRLAHPFLRLAHGVVTVVEDRGAQDGVGAALVDGIHEVVEGSSAA